MPLGLAWSAATPRWQGTATRTIRGGQTTGDVGADRSYRDPTRSAVEICLQFSIANQLIKACIADGEQPTGLSGSDNQRTDAVQASRFSRLCGCHGISAHRDKCGRRMAAIRAAGYGQERTGLRRYLRPRALRTVRSSTRRPDFFSKSRAIAFRVMPAGSPLRYFLSTNDATASRNDGFPPTARFG